MPLSNKVLNKLFASGSLKSIGLFVSRERNAAPRDSLVMFNLVLPNKDFRIDIIIIFLHIFLHNTSVFYK